MCRVKKIFAYSFFVGTLLAGVLVFLILDSKPIIIESEESKTKELTPVFNEIRFIPEKNKDIWMMNQSHYGRHPGSEKWDRLAIIIDKTKKPAVATFYQLKPGPLVWEEGLIQKRVPYRASCFICHNNGPRAIRPIYESEHASLSLADKVKIQAWNLRIKTYGRIRYSVWHDSESSKPVPFAFKGSPDTDLLKVKTCSFCHNEDGIFARGFLQRQQTTTIASLVKRGQMPPRGFHLSEKEKMELEDFLRGF